MNVAFLIYNRPELTRQVFAAISKVRPSGLLVVADGPNPNRPGDQERVAAARRIVEHIDWPCEVRRNYSEVNLGCRRRVASGLDWVFSKVDEAIILEDDCLPDPSFFHFCSELLDRYRGDERIMHISGANLQADKCGKTDSYYFSRYPYIWGWASWRRAWKYYDAELKAWPGSERVAQSKVLCNDPEELVYWAAIFDKVKAGRVDSWDYAWVHACFARAGLSIVPSVNLISNIGFSDDATHTLSGSPLANLPTGSITDVRHPAGISVSEQLDTYSFRNRINPRRGWSARVADSVLNRHWWGNSLRKCPVLGRFWSDLRR